MQFPGDASASAVRADPGTWLVGARPGAGARTRGARVRRAAIGGGDYVVARGRARAMAGALRSRGLLLYAQPDALRAHRRRSPTTRSPAPPDAWRAAVADPNLDPPPVTPTSPLIALLDTRLDETHPEFAGSQHEHARRPPARQPARHRDRRRRRGAQERASASSASGPAPGRSTSRCRPTR